MRKIQSIKINKKVVSPFLLGAFIFGCLGVGATSLIYSKDVAYDNTLSGLKSTTVQGALDELYESAKNGGAKVSCNDNGECTVTCPQGTAIMNDTGYSCPTKVTCPEGENFLTYGEGYKCTNLPVKDNVVTSGDGLYEDTVTNGRYYYRGANPDNYIKFNNTTWRIISIESNGMLKIISYSDGGTQSWDIINHRSSSTSTYCTNASEYGCDAWAATKNLVNKPSTFIQYSPNGNSSDSTRHSGTVTQDSDMATYLNGSYYNNILSSEAKTNVVKGIFNVSTPGNSEDTESLETDAQQEKQYQWEGYVALYTITEFLRASTDKDCKSLEDGYYGHCRGNNWLVSNLATWTLSPGSYNSSVWMIASGGYAQSGNATYQSFKIRPVLHLSSNISLSGTGSSSDPYVIN